MFALAGTQYLYNYHSGKVASGEYIDLFLHIRLVLKSSHSFVQDTLLDSSELDWMVIRTWPELDLDGSPFAVASQMAS